MPALLLTACLFAATPKIPAIAPIPVPSQLAAVPAATIHLPPGEWFDEFLVVHGPKGLIVCFSTTDRRPGNRGKHVFRGANGAPLLIVHDPKD